MTAPLTIVCPLPPVRSGIADYTLEQLPLYAAGREVRVVVGDDQPADESLLPDGVRVLRPAQLHSGEWDVGPLVYHQGNNIHHAYVYRELQRRSGILVLHDFVLHHLIVEMTLACGNEAEYARILEAEHGEVGLRTAQLRSRGCFTEYQQFLMPLNREAVRASKGVVVHSDWARRLLVSEHPEIPIACIPHHYSPPAESIEAMSVSQARAAVGRPTDRLVFAALGFVTPPKRIDMAMKALGAARDQLPPFEFWLVGEVSDAVNVKQLATDNGIGDRVHVFGYVDLRTFQTAIRAADVIINLRYPTAGETSGTLVRALGMGKPVVVYDHASFSDFPDHVVAKVPLDTAWIDPLAEMVQRLGTDDEYRQQLGSRAAAYVRSEHDLAKCVNSYLDFIAEVYPTP